MSATALKRLRREYKDMCDLPVGLIRAAPLESNLLEWHYVIQGSKGTPYSGGWYHGQLLFPPEYPYKPPGVLMQTPNGRFRPNTRLCLSMSDFHPESWNPMWSVHTILVGLQSFMLENSATSGSISTSYVTKRELAAQSLDFNCRDKVFCELFPELVELNNSYKQKKLQQQGMTSRCSGQSEVIGVAADCARAPEFGVGEEAKPLEGRNDVGIFGRFHELSPLKYILTGILMSLIILFLVYVAFFSL